jgi:hypothetical protein
MAHPTQSRDIKPRLDREDLFCLELPGTETGSLVQFES